MVLALMVGVAVCVVLALMGAAGYVIDRSAARLEAGAGEGRKVRLKPDTTYEGNTL